VCKGLEDWEELEKRLESNRHGQPLQRAVSKYHFTKQQLSMEGIGRLATISKIFGKQEVYEKHCGFLCRLTAAALLSFQFAESELVLT